MKKSFLTFLLITSTVLIHSQIVLFGERVPVNRKQVEIQLKNTINKLVASGVTPDNLKTRSDKYFPYIEQIIKKYGLPDDFKYLAIAESMLNPKATSSAGAKGLWQFMPSTAREYGLIVNSSIDEREDIELSTHTAMRYLAKNYNYLNSWILTASSYNCGLGCIKNEIKQGRTNDFFKFTLNRETTEYIYKICSIKLLYEEYYLKGKKYNAPRPSETLTRSKDVDTLKLITLDSIKFNTITPRAPKLVKLSSFTAFVYSNYYITKDTTIDIYIKGSKLQKIPCKVILDQNQKRAYLTIEGMDISSSEYQVAKSIGQDFFDGINLSDNLIKNKFLLAKNTSILFNLYNYE